jgi:hypothetical protein
MENRKPVELSEEELAQVRKAMEDFCNAPISPVVKKEEVAVPPVIEKQEEPKPKRKRKIWTALVAAAVAVALAVGIGYGYWAALPGNHPNSMANRKQTIASGFSTAAILNDGTMGQVITLSPMLADLSEWTDMVSVSMGARHGVGVRADGSVVSVGNDKYCTECDRWENITAVAAGSYHTVGLQKDGRVVATGQGDYGQCEVEGWKHIAGVAAGAFFTAGLRMDGKVLITPIRTVESALPSAATQIEQTNLLLRELEEKLAPVQQWEDIIAIAAWDSYLLGLKEDGTVVSAGLDSFGRCDVSGWTDIVSIAAGSTMSAGVRSDGTVVTAGTMRLDIFSSVPQEDTSEEPLDDALAGLTKEEKIVSASIGIGRELYLLSEDGILYRVAYSRYVYGDDILSGYIKTGLQIEEVLTNVRLP